MIADSLPLVGARPLLMISWTWSCVIMPPIIVVCQSSLEAIKVPAALCSSSVGLANTSGTPNGVSSGPIARIITFFGALPWTMKPPIITLSAVWTKLRVLMLPSMAVGVGVVVDVCVTAALDVLVGL